jgi:ABC-type polysaccharide/polyol phosphate transport system ATPase subunit
MSSTVSSETLLSVKNVRVFFNLEHYQLQGLREVFISALSHPLEFFFKQKEMFYVLDGVSLNLSKGMRLGILGVNGSGKTTLCRCMAGMMKPQEGKIETRAEVRAIFDTGTGVLPELTGRENAMLLARLFFPDEKNIKNLVEEAILFSELGHFIDTPFKTYSKGMQSRLMLSLISAKTSDILILDEVFDGADLFFQKKMAERMKKLIETAGATIFVSHSPDQIRQVCNKVMVINKGKLHFFGDIEEGINSFLNLKL